jgi:hypothetical protein
LRTSTSATPADRGSITPLATMARRIAPAVACGLVTFSEALDSLMGHAVARGQCDDYFRGLALEAWVASALAREAEAFLARRAAA